MTSSSDLTTDRDAFEAQVRRHARELQVHCYRMTGSVEESEDLVQETFLRAWRKREQFAGRSTLRAWLYRIATNVCLRFIDRRPRRLLSPEQGPPRTATEDLGEPVPGPVWLEPWLTGEPHADPEESDPAARFERRESVELAFVAALQHLPATQRAVLVLREVLGFSAAETAGMLDTTTASVNSALQRARKTIEERVPSRSQQVELDALGRDGRRELVQAFVAAWERADLDALLALLTADARFTMPPLPAWFDGRANVGRFLAERVFATSWRLVPLEVNAQLGFACYRQTAPDEPFRLGAVNVLALRAGEVCEITGFLDPELHARLGTPLVLPAPGR